MKLQAKKFVPLSIVFASGLILAACQAPGSETPAMEAAPAETAPSETTNEQSATETDNMVTELRTTGNYESPAGSEEVGFVLFVDENGVITDAEAEVMAENKTSVFRQQSFADAFPEIIIGKNINELENVDRIGGSSLTTKSFNESLADLKAQANS